MKKSVHTKDYAVFVDTLREVRQACGVTQVELAKKLRQTQSFVSKIENGQARLDVIQLRTILKVLGTTLPAFVKKLEAKLGPS
jgi:transcriptional regulator with XRE-family HTH domain